MVIFDFDPVKSIQLKHTRGISFEEMITLIETGHVVTTVVHPNPKKYPNQFIYYVDNAGYIFEVPWVQDGDRIFLKTIFPSCKATKQYVKERSHD